MLDENIYNNDLNSTKKYMEMFSCGSPIPILFMLLACRVETPYSKNISITFLFNALHTLIQKSKKMDCTVWNYLLLCFFSHYVLKQLFVFVVQRF